MLCPSNPCKLSETYNDLLAYDPNLDTCVERLGSPPGMFPDGSPRINACRQIGAGPMAPGPARTQIVEEQILDKGYNTNYVATWFLVRSEVRVNANGNLLGKPGCATSIAANWSTAGPLHLARLSGLGTSSTHLPLLACAQPADLDTGMLSAGVGSHRAGDRLATTITGGPILNSTLSAPVFSGVTPYTGPAGWWAGWNQTKQDYRNFAPVHSGSCNMLFGDGSVRSFADANGDGFLNNGFDPAATGLKLGYADAQIELPDDQISSSWSIDPERVRPAQ
jgi:prepilin-type processing-associated H-X9-DG protein